MTTHAPKPTDELVTHVTEILGRAGRIWLGELPELIAELERRWHITVGEPFAAGEFNFVAAARTNDGEPVVLKIAPPYPDNEARSEAAYLRYKAGEGCVRLIHQDRPLRSMLLERALPGENVAEIFAGSPVKMIEPGVEVLTAIACPEPADTSECLSLDRWFAGLEAAPAAGFSPAFARRALKFYAELRTERPAGYLHGDFHPGNIVSAQRERYLVIDAKGLIGHIGYDVAVYLNNLLFIHRDRQELHDAARMFAGALQMDEEHVRRWAYAGWVIGKWWSFKDMPACYEGGVEMAEFWLD